MTFRELSGLGLTIAGIVVLPIAWTFSRVLWIFAGVLIFVGVALFYTERVHKKAEQLDKESGGSKGGPCVPGDAHNYSGWQTGGRSGTMDGDSGGGGGD